MHGIPEGVTRLWDMWDMWDIRVLVVLSLTLQIILSIFGHRRKYIPSLWISILVWLAYLTADWVATVALGKLSDAPVNKDNDNALRAIWAPLLLLHLGGPDTITAYALEDNQLWMRHLLGLVVQSSVAIYVILMSWEHTWFSFVSFPALVAGVIKYGERTWVLKSVSGDKSEAIVPFGNLLPTDSSDYLGDVTFARYILMEFKRYTENYDLRYNPFGAAIDGVANIDILWNALEVEMGLIYDLLYTKTTINYTKRGCIFRCISFACTVFVLIGLIFRVIFMREEEKRHKVDIAITGVLLVGALMLEIYSVIALHLTSDWAMLWLINYGRGQDVIKLRSKIPLLFNNKKNWSKMIGQFDLLSFSPKDQKLNRRILGGLLRIIDCKDVFNRYVHKTFVHGSPDLYSAILEYFVLLMSSDVDESSGLNEERKISEILHLHGIDIPHRIIYIHILTGIFYHSDKDVASESAGFDEQNMETTRTLSQYMIYLLAMHPSLLSVSRATSDDILLGISSTLGIYNRDPEVQSAFWQNMANGGFKVVFDAAIKYLKGKPKAERWKILKFVWLRMLCYAAIKGQKDLHLQQLRQGDLEILKEKFPMLLPFTEDSTLGRKDTRVYCSFVKMSLFRHNYFFPNVLRNEFCYSCKDDGSVLTFKDDESALTFSDTF